jgi:ABC-type nitrate/sulfonate/bicarbonate transport system permease component
MSEPRKIRSFAPDRRVLPWAFGLLLVLMVEWLVASGHAPAGLVRPSEVAKLLLREHGGYLAQLRPTLVVAGWAYLVSLVLALLLGFLVYAFEIFERPVLVAGAVLSSLPIIAIAPILSVWLGLGLSARILITVIICIFPLLLSVIQGLKSASVREQELFAVLAASNWQRFRYLALPGALPYVFVGMKVAAPLAVLGALVAEWNGAETGLGVLMLNAMFGLQITRLWASVVIVCVLSSLAYAYVCVLEGLALPGASRERSQS